MLSHQYHKIESTCLKKPMREGNENFKFAYAWQFEVDIKQTFTHSFMSSFSAAKKILLILYLSSQSFSYKNHCKCYKNWHLACGLCYLSLPIFSFLHLLFCWKIKSCFDCCSPQQIRPQTTVQ